MYVESKLPEIKRIIEASGVRGKQGDVAVVEFVGPKNVNSYWDDGSRSEYAIVDLDSCRAWQVPSTHPFYDRRPDGERCGNLELRELPPNCCLVQGGTFCGKNATYRLHFRPENLAKLLPSQSAELSEGAKSALRIICSIKGGYRQDEFTRAGLGRYGADSPLIQELKSAGFVTINKAGAIAVTTAGRNARG